MSAGRLELLKMWLWVGAFLFALGIAGGVQQMEAVDAAIAQEMKP